MERGDAAPIVTVVPVFLIIGKTCIGFACTGLRQRFQLRRVVGRALPERAEDNGRQRERKG